MSDGTAPPQPPFIIRCFMVNPPLKGSPHPPRIERLLEERFLWRLVLVRLRLCLLEVVNREKNCFRLLIIYIGYTKNYAKIRKTVLVKKMAPVIRLRLFALYLL